MMGNKKPETENKARLFGKIIKDSADTVVILGKKYSVYNICVLRNSEENGERKRDIIRLLFKRLTSETLNLIEQEATVVVNGTVCSYDLDELKDGVRTFMCVKVDSLEDARELEEPNVTNFIKIKGTLCSDIAVRGTRSGRLITGLIIVVEAEESQIDGMYLYCLAWGKYATALENVPKGQMISLVGRLQSRPYAKTLVDGTVETRVAYEVSACYLEKLETRFI